MSQLNMAEQNAPKLQQQKGYNSQAEMKQYQFNGVHSSSHSSRDSSPIPRTVPASQLPPGRQIPASQLPPSASPINQINQKFGSLGVNEGPKFNSTPNSSTPTFRGQNSFSPISVPKTVFDNVPLSESADRTEQKVPQINGAQQKLSPSNHFEANGQFRGSAFNAYSPKGVQPSNMSLPMTTQNAPPAVSNTNSMPFISKPMQRPPTYNNAYSVNSGIMPTVPNNQAVSQPTLSNAMNQPPGPQAIPQLPQTTAMNQPPRPIVTPQAIPQLPQPTSMNQPVRPPNAVTSQAFPQLPLSSGMNQPPRPPLPTVSTIQTIPQQPQPTASINPLRPPMPSVTTNQAIPQMPVSTVSMQQSTNPPPLRQAAPSQRYPLPNRYPTQNINAYNFQTQVQPQSPFNPQPQNYTNQQYGIQQQQQYVSNQYNQNPRTESVQNTYPGQVPYQQQQQYQGVAQTGFNKYWGTESYDLLQNANVLPPTKLETPQVHLQQEQLDQANCSPDIFRCTMTKIPESNNLLQKSRLPLGVLIHPFRDLNHLPVIQCSVIVRCRTCRTYINPFVYFVDSKRWKCNLCYRINELPEEFQYDPVTKSYGDPSRRPEIKSSTIEYIAPAEYMLRPPQPAIYLFLLDVSRLAVESGYLYTVVQVLQEEIKNLPGDARTQIGFIAYDSALHFFWMAEGLSQPHEMIVLDIDDVFLPYPDNLLVNLKDRMDMVVDFLNQLPKRFSNTFDTNSALGAALQAAYKMMGATGGRVTVFQAALPNFGPGALTAREDPAQRSGPEVAHLNPANDFYKRLALECSGQQIAVDLFVLNSQYVDLATISGISRFSGGCIHHFPLFKYSRSQSVDAFEKCFRRYLTRKIGFEAVMRIRCTRGLSIHTFHGNFFVRSTDLLSLPNINPDAGFGMQVAIDENLSDVQSVCFQAALLYTSSKGERRIRVHTLCLPIASTLHDVIHSADQQCIVGLLGKMAVDRSMQSSLSDAREAFINVAIDILSSYKVSLNMGSSSSGLMAPKCLSLLPLYISALLKHPAFKIGNIRLDDRVKAMVDMKTKPLYMLIQMVYPDLYAIHDLEACEVILNADEEPVHMPSRLQLSSRNLDNKGVFLLDCGEHMIILVLQNAPSSFLSEGLGVADYNSITDSMYEVPVLNNATNKRLHQLLDYLNEDKPFAATLQVLRENSPHRAVFFERLIEDRFENALSYHEFLQHLKTQVK